MRRVGQRLESAGPDADHYQVCESYSRQWFDGNRGWTKVPIHSLNACLTITSTYVDDWFNHIPMGGFTMKDFDKSKPFGGFYEKIAALPPLPNWAQKKP
jgi:hypothetical protein